MKLDYFKDCVIGTELKLDLFLERNRGLMSEFTADALQLWIDKKAVVLRFSVKPSYEGSVLYLDILIDGVYSERVIGLMLPKQVEA